MKALDLLAQCLEALAKVSWQAAVLVLAVLMIQWLLRKRLSAKWRYGLWMIVLLRLLLPVSLESPLSLFNYTRPPEAFSAGTIEISKSVFKYDGPIPEDNSTVSPVVPKTWTTSRILGLLWALGAGGIALYMIVAHVLFSRRLRKSRRQVTEPKTVDFLEECKRLVGVRRIIPLWESAIVETPALWGTFRPKLLLPKGITQKFSSDELRFIFLHELCHLKRGDLLSNWILILSNVLHWFNPLIWFAFTRMRTDREMACDALVLSLSPGKENKQYGRIIIKLTEGFSRPALLPSLVGILENNHQIKRRITMIAKFKKSKQWPVLALLALAGLAIVSLTDAQSTRDMDVKVVTLNDNDNQTKRLELVQIPAGTFMMGSPEGEKDYQSDEGPQTKVTISQTFWIGKFEITQAQYQAVMGHNPSEFKGDPNRPVEKVPWNNAIEFCLKLSKQQKAQTPKGYVYRLPTEAEWEYACRAGTTTRFSFGDNEQELPNYANFGDINCSHKEARKWADKTLDDSYADTAPVGEKKPNSWGLHDMHGNVHEWCLDWFGKYPGGLQTDPIGPSSGSVRLARGACWCSPARICRSAFRNYYLPKDALPNVGFRIVLAPALTKLKDTDSNSALDVDEGPRNTDVVEPNINKATQDEAIEAIKKQGISAWISDDETLFISGIKGDSDMEKIKPYLQELKDLHLLLDVSTSKITDEGLIHIKNLTQVRKLYLNNTQITDAGLPHLKDLTNLEALSLKGTKVSEKGREELLKSIPELRFE
jgi:formylglycine-generating enzyme required for sulfatase activity/Zn-dependent protease with chaperone function